MCECGCARAHAQAQWLDHVNECNDVQTKENGIIVLQWVIPDGRCRRCLAGWKGVGTLCGERESTTLSSSFMKSGFQTAKRKINVRKYVLFINQSVDTFFFFFESVHVEAHSRAGDGSGGHG